MKLNRAVIWLAVLGIVLGLAVTPVFAQAPEKGKAPAATAKEKPKKAEAVAQTPPEKGMVWVNTESKVYHKEGSRWYGKSKNGKWMTEADAQKEGYKEAGKGGAKPGGKKAAAAKKA